MPSPSTPRAVQRIQALDGMRGLAVLLVVWFHSMRPALASSGVAQSGVDRAYAGFVSFGWFGVDLFFVLSGYLITGILWESRSAERYFRNFYARRMLRIFPLYYAVVALLLFVLPHAPATTTETVSYLTYWANIWLSWHPEAAHVDLARVITWSLAIEEQYYLVWPAVVFFASRRQAIGICVLLVVGAAVLRLSMLHSGSHAWTIYVLTPCRIDTIALGSLLVFVRPGAGTARVVGALAALALGAIAVQDGHAYPTTKWMQQAGYSLNVLLAGSVLVLATGHGIVARMLEAKWLVTLGVYSYAMYLLHILVIEQLEKVLLLPDAPLPLAPWIRAWGYTMPHVVFAAACVLATLLVAFASWHLFEKHFVALKRHFPAR